MIEFGDYECPVCRRTYPNVEEFLQNNPGVGFGHRHYPLTRIHPRADAAARAAVRAEAQGRFREMHTLLYTRDEWLSDGNREALAADAGVEDLSLFTQCLSDSTTDQRLLQDRDHVEALGLIGTPSFVSESGIHSGLASVTTLEDLLSR